MHAHAEQRTEPDLRPAEDPLVASQSGIRGDWLAMLPGLSAYAVLAFAFSAFVTDDALITLRYARQWAAGHGIRWNVGEDPVEGFTNFSHVALGAAALYAGLPALTVVRAFNVLASLGAVAIAYALAQRALDDRRFAGAAALLVGAHSASAYWSVSGLETSSYAALLLLGMWALDSGRVWLAGAALLLAAITRMEGAVAALAIGGAYVGVDLLRNTGSALRRHAPWACAWLLCYGAYFAWRWHYFGHPISNSAYFKTRGDPDAALVLDFMKQAAPVLLLMPLAPYRKLGALGLSCLALVAVYFIGYYGVRPSVSYLHRFFVPVYAPAVLLAVSALWRVWRAAGERRRWSIAVAAAFATVLTWDLVNPYCGVARAAAQTKDKGARMVSRARVAAFIAEGYGASVRVLVQDVGVIGYALQNPIIDSFGLNSEAYTHTFQRKRRRYLQAVLETRPDVLVLVTKHANELVPQYMTDDAISKQAAFTEYRRVHVVRSASERYHYMIYAHEALARGQATRRPARIVVDASTSTARMLEATASAIWAAQEASSH